jgi:hypothetical protein
MLPARNAIGRFNAYRSAFARSYSPLQGISFTKMSSKDQRDTPVHRRQKMPGRKDYIQEKFEHGKASIHAQLAEYKQPVREIASGKGATALKNIGGLFFNFMPLVLDHFYVHRLRMVTGKDGNPLDQVEMICDSLMNNNGIFHDSIVNKYIPDQPVVKPHVGDKMSLSADEFERLSAAFIAEWKCKFLET